MDYAYRDGNWDLAESTKTALRKIGWIDPEVFARAHAHATRQMEWLSQNVMHWSPEYVKFLQCIGGTGTGEELAAWVDMHISNEIDSGVRQPDV